MPIAATLQYLKSLLDGLAMPGALPDLAAYINPPDPNVEGGIPAAYIWAPDFDESRSPDQGGTIPRNTGPRTPSGTKALEHMTEIFVVFFQANDDPQADTTFFGILDAIMYRLRTCDDPARITDPYTGQESQLYDIGEVMRGRTTISATADQAYNRLDGLLTCTLHEIFQA